MLYAKFYQNATTTVTIPIINLGDISGAIDTPPISFRQFGGVNNLDTKGDDGQIAAAPNTDLVTQLSIHGDTLYSSPHLSHGITTSIVSYGNYVQVLDTNEGVYNWMMGYAGSINVINVYLAVAIIDGIEYLGFAQLSGYDWETRTMDDSCWCFAYNSATLQTILHDITLTDEIGNIADIGGIGGEDGDYDFTGDTIDLPNTPDETISGVLASGFLNVYSPSASQLKAFGGLLWTNAFNVKWYDYDSVSQLLLNAVSDPINFIVGLFILPITPSTGAGTGIYLGGINANTVTAPRITQQFKTVDFGTLDISELYGNYLDYSNSRLSIYLPYIGTADIDVQEVNGGSITLQYVIDCFTGACVANVKCVKSTKTPWGETYNNSTVHSYSGNAAIQLPMNAGSFDTLLQGLINVGLGMGTNTPAMVMNGSKDVMQGFSGDVTTRGSLSSNTGKLCYQTPYLMFTRPIESRPAHLGSLHGYSAGVGGTLSSFNGYVECSDVKLDGVTATEKEINEIESMLKSGVYV